VVDRFKDIPAGLEREEVPMFGTKFSAIAMAAVRIAAVGMAALAGTLLIVAPRCRAMS
jgi:hypothetical protein